MNIICKLKMEGAVNGLSDWLMAGPSKSQMTQNICFTTQTSSSQITEVLLNWTLPKTMLSCSTILFLKMTVYTKASKYSKCLLLLGALFLEAILTIKAIHTHIYSSSNKGQKSGSLHALNRFPKEVWDWLGYTSSIEDSNWTNDVTWYFLEEWILYLCSKY